MIEPAVLKRGAKRRARGLELPHFSGFDEQRDIVGYSRTRSSKLSGAATQAEQEAGRLHEYRTRLIADVVTGKLDVREAAAALLEVDLLAAEDALDDTLDTDTDAPTGPIPRDAESVAH